MTDTAANNDFAPRNSGFRLNKYSYILKDFTPAADAAYPFEVKNDKVYVNLTTYEERTAFFAELKEKNVRARETLYEYFVPATHLVEGEQASFQGLVKYLQNLVASNDSTKNLRRCFKVSNDNANFKVVVSSYALASILNEARPFFPYRKRTGAQRSNEPRTGRVQRSTQEDGVSVGDHISYASSANANSYARSVGRGKPQLTRQETVVEAASPATQEPALEQ